MKTFLILGAGTAGTMVANKMSQHLDPMEWKIVVVDKDETHIYQPGLLFIPFDIYTREDVIKPRRDYLPRSVEFIRSDIELIEPGENRVRLTHEKRVINYDYLVIATGSRIAPAETDGLLDNGWHENVFDFYTLEGAVALSRFLKFWKGGRMVLNIAEMPIKCPVAPLEFLFLADWFFHERGMRDQVEITLATPLPGAFTRPRAAAILGDMLERKGIAVEAEFNIMEVDHEKNVIRSYDEREIPFDLLVTIPTNMGAEVIERSGMGNELAFVPTDNHTLQSKQWENVWVIGDAADVPTSKAGSVAHFMLDVVIENILRHMEGLKPLPKFDGHANCFIESGFDKGILIDFNYDVEPLPGKYPLPGLGPFSLLQESSVNHWGKMLFRWIYWNALLKGEELPFESQMSMAGKWS
ncbi:MAG TPA: NAD(P)/FAD-dependent oxidoreductase [Anaerolineae bacterium]|nr:NAD(P)/FAD-dependent oxidoreductase [Anaerolineae bacterium]